MGRASRATANAIIYAIIYARGTIEDIEQQIIACYALCAERGYEPYAIAQDLPGETAGFEQAMRLREPGMRIVVARADVLPEFLESATGTLPGSRPHGRGQHRRTTSPRQRRPRPAC